MSSNPVVILTGAASGIGAALLPLLIRGGYRVVASDIASLPESDDHLNYRCDVGDPQHIDQLLTFTIRQFGKVDVFIANAGFAYYEKAPAADWSRTDHIFRVNAFAPIYVAHKMSELNNGQPFQVMITASAMSFWPLPGYAQYAATKAALHAFAVAYRHELASNQHLQLVYPIGTRTSFFDRANHGPAPLMTQSAEQVAKAMMEGLQSKADTIYPSTMFKLMHRLNQVFPVVRSIVVALEKRGFKNKFKVNR